MRKKQGPSDALFRAIRFLNCVFDSLYFFLVLRTGSRVLAFSENVVFSKTSFKHHQIITNTSPYIHMATAQQPLGVIRDVSLARNPRPWKQGVAGRVE